MKSSQQDHEFDTLMKEFREACVHAAHREHTAAHVARQSREAAAMRAEVRLRWGVPAFAALALMVAGGSWGAWWYTHPGPNGRPAGHETAQVTGAANTVADPQAVSDETVLSEVQSDLSDRVPQALEPLAVSYTSNSQARSGQEEMQ